MEDYSMLSDLAGKLEIPVKERSNWVEKQMTLKIRNEELKLRNKELELCATKRKPNDTSEDQSLGDALTNTKSNPPEQKKAKLGDALTNTKSNPPEQKKDKMDDVPCNAAIINPQKTKEDKKVPKKRRWHITKKIEVIAQLEAGKTESELASKHDISRSTISTWLLKKDEIKKKYAEYKESFSANAQSSHPKTKKIKQSDTAEKIIQPQPEKPKEQNAPIIGAEKKFLFDYVVKEFDWETAAEEMTKKGYPRTSTQLRDKIKRQLNKKNKKNTKKVLLRN